MRFKIPQRGVQYLSGPMQYVVLPLPDGKNLFRWPSFCLSNLTPTFLNQGIVRFRFCFILSNRLILEAIAITVTPAQKTLEGYAASQHQAALL